MRQRYTILMYWLLFSLPIIAMTVVAYSAIRQEFDMQFVDWWVVAAPKLVFITIGAAVLGTFIGIPLAKTLAQFAPPITLKNGLEVFSMTAIGVVLTLLFSWITGFKDAAETLFFASYVVSILLLTIALYITIYCFKR